MENRDDLERYFQDEMSNQERSEFEKQLGDNDDLVADLEFYRNLEKVAGARSVVNNFKNHINSEKKTAGIFTIRRVISVAASFLLVLTFSFLFYSNTFYSNESLAITTESELGLRLNSRVREINNEKLNRSQFREGIKAYEEENIEEAKKIFSQITSTDDNYLNAQLFLSLIYLSLQDYDSANKAALAIQKRIGDEKDLMYMKAEWLQLKALIGLNNKAELSNLLNKIASDPSHQYYDRALVLKDNLNSIWRFFVF